MTHDAARLVAGEAWRSFCRRLESTGDRIPQDDFPADPRSRAEGFRAPAAGGGVQLRVSTEARSRGS